MKVIDAVIKISIVEKMRSSMQGISGSRCIFNQEIIDFSKKFYIKLF